MLDDLKKIQKLYEDGENIISYLKNKYGKRYDINELVSISYDIQAGTYVEKFKLNQKHERERGEAFSKIFNQLGEFSVLLESGIGEGTSHASITSFLTHNDYRLLGFDISYSRIKYAKSFLSQQPTVKPHELFLGDYLHCPLADNSADIVYTVHSMEPSGGNEVAIIKELYRVAGKYLVLFEPSYELGSQVSRDHIDKHGYVKGLYKLAKELKLNVIEHKLLFDGNDLTHNNTAVIVIEKSKEPPMEKSADTEWACPVTKTYLEDMGDCFYSKNSFLLYPVVKSIPCLLPKNAIMASHFLEQ